MQNHLAKLTFMVLMGAAASAHAGIVGAYEFTDNSLDATSIAPGLVFSTMTNTGGKSGSLGWFTSATADELRIDGHGPTQTTISAAISNSQWLRFTITILDGYVLNLDNIQVNISGSSINNFSRGQVYSSVHGYDQVTNDSLGNLGYTTSGTTTMALQTVDLNNPVGSNVTAADHDGLTGTITFTIPWIDDSSSTTRWVTLFDITVNGEVALIPEPGSLALIAVGTLLVLPRRRRV